MPEPEAKEVKYPEHEKLQEIKERSQAIGDFLEWLKSEKQIVFCKWSQIENDTDGEAYYNEELDAYVIDELVPQSVPLNETLAEYFGIDLNKLEAEKRAMIEECRKANATS